MAVVRIELESIACHFHELEDPRSSINQRHPFVSVVVIALMATLAGANGPTSIAQWAEAKKDFLLGALDLRNGIPRKDVFRRVLCALNPTAFQACFTEWLKSLRQRAAEATGITQPILAVDGKTHRRSHDRKRGLGALHSVSIWASEFGIALGQVACEEKSNESNRSRPEMIRLPNWAGRERDFRQLLAHGNRDGLASDTCRTRSGDDSRGSRVRGVALCRDRSVEGGDRRTQV